MKKIDTLLLEAEPKKPANYKFTHLEITRGAGGGFKVMQGSTSIIKAFKLIRGEIGRADVVELYFKTAAELETYLETIPKPRTIAVDADIYNGGKWIETETSPKANGNSQ